MVSVNVSAKESLPSESAEASELHHRLCQLNLHWETAQGKMDSWRETLRQSLLQCQVCWLAQA